jgi:hypothetical protein
MWLGLNKCLSSSIHNLLLWKKRPVFSKIVGGACAAKISCNLADPLIYSSIFFLLVIRWGEMYCMQTVWGYFVLLKLSRSKLNLEKMEVENNWYDIDMTKVRLLLISIIYIDYLLLVYLLWFCQKHVLWMHHGPNYEYATGNQRRALYNKEKTLAKWWQVEIARIWNLSILSLEIKLAAISIIISWNSCTFLRSRTLLLGSGTCYMLFFS